MKKMVFALSSLAFVATAVVANQQTAFQEYRQGEFVKAKPMLERLAGNNNPVALYYLANMKLHGYGESKDHEAGIQLMTQAAEKKYLPAQMYLGQYYFQKKKDLNQALVWLQKAANQGNASAQMFTALCYLKSLCGKKSPDLAKKYVIKAAQSGIPMAQYELAELFLKSKHKSDKKMGRIWMLKAAKKNYPDAAAALGMRLYSGNEMTMNKERGIEWLKKAESLGSDAAKQQLLVINESKTAAVEGDEKNELSKPANATEESADVRWQKMQDALKKAHISLSNPNAITAETGVIMTTPKITPFSKSLVVNPSYCLLSPAQVPLGYIIAMAMKHSYLQEKNKIKPTLYKFKLPVGAESNEQALALLERQAGFGHVQAIFKLGQMYELGLAGQKDAKKAFELYMQAAKRSYLKAEYMVGLYYYEGKVVPKDDEKALTWLQQAALHGSGPAQLLLANILESGPNKNIAHAIGFYSLAAQNNLPQADYRLAQMYVLKSLNDRNIFTSNKDDFAMAKKLFKKAVDNGLEEAKLDLAYFYATKKATEDQQEFAYKVAHDQPETNKKAQLLQAVLYDRGIGTSQDPSDAMSIYKSLAGKMDGVADLMLGSYYYLEDQDKEDAAKYLNLAAQKGNPYAYYNLAMLAKSSSTDTQDGNAQFALLLSKASSLGYTQADILLADHYLLNAQNRTQAAKAVRIYQKLAAQNNSAAQLKLGVMYQTGTYFPKNLMRAKQFYEKSAGQDNPIAQYALGYLYQTGVGVKHSLSEAQKYYMQSAKQDYAPALVALGYIDDVNRHDYAKAVKYYEAAEKLNSAQADYNLGLMYQYGKGVEKDDDKAKELFNESKVNKSKLSSCNKNK